MIVPELMCFIPRWMTCIILLRQCDVSPLTPTPFDTGRAYHQLLSRSPLVVLPGMMFGKARNPINERGIERTVETTKFLPTPSQSYLTESILTSANSQGLTTVFRWQMWQLPSLD